MRQVPAREKEGCEIRVGCHYASRRTFYLTYLAYLARNETNGYARRDDQQSQGSIKGVGYVGRSFCFSSGRFCLSYQPSPIRFLIADQNAKKSYQ